MSQSVYIGEPNGDLSQNIVCPELGLVSPKACESCRLRRSNKCPVGKEPN